MFIDHTVRLFLDSLGRHEEYEFYLRKFKSDRSGCFALLSTDLDSLRLQGDVFFVNLSFLLRLELIPAILLCGPLAPTMLGLLKEHDQHKILAYLPLKNGTDPLDHQTMQRAVQQKQIPVILATHLTLPQAIPEISPHLSQRLHFLRSSGGLHNTENQKVLYCKNQTPLDTLREEDRAITRLARELLAQQSDLHISISSPLNLLKEIFTIKGAGSIVRIGSQIRFQEGRQLAQQQQLHTLLKQSFPRTLKFDYQIPADALIFHDQNYQGAMILEALPWGYYLSKFAVGPQARGIGIGQELWEAMLERVSRLFWRSRPNNGINRWYRQIADGQHRLRAEGDQKPEWLVFWKGIETASIAQAIEYCHKRPDDFT